MTATRRYVFHGSKALPRRGYRVVSYDARGHGESEPAPGGSGYGYPELAADLGRVLGERAAGSPVLVGNSMGCHTAAAYALDHSDELAGAVFVGPESLGLPRSDEALAYWDGLAAGLERAGVQGFMRAYEAGLTLEGRWREVVLRITRERIALHRRPEALAAALREVTRSRPFDGLSELESLGLPALVVASHDEADPGHPYDVAAAWAESLPNARLVSEDVGESPLAWQGGRLSREVAEFCERPEVAARLGP
ncbi:MAG: alpha/beta hydrolase [Actinomycetota bacterium]|nr:alpha/beta hydrolase [Actinomycetota bacterium]